MPVSCFLLFSFQKTYTGNILGIARDENPPSYIAVMYTETEGETEGGHGAPTPPGGAGPTPAHREVVWGPQGSPGVSLPPIYTPSSENPKHRIKYA